jgi:SAM-dependent methyltransferase
MTILLKDGDDVNKGYGLSENVYSYGYNLRLKYASFRRATMKWLVDNSGELIGAESPKILSLGCGDGAFDMEFIHHLRQQRKHVQFSGLDFNSADLEHFRGLLLTQDEAIQECITLREESFEPTTSLGETYDFIYMVHFLHSFEKVLPVIRNALAHLTKSGKLLIIQQKRQGIYELKEKFKHILPNKKFHSSEGIKSLLRADNISFDAHAIDTYFDITIMQDMSLDTLLLMSFCLTNDLSMLDKWQQEEIRREFLAYAEAGQNGAPCIYEPMEAIVCEGGLIAGTTTNH